MDETMAIRFKLGTRGSPLALTQALLPRLQTCSKPTNKVLRVGPIHCGWIFVSGWLRVRSSRLTATVMVMRLMWLPDCASALDLGRFGQQKWLCCWLAPHLPFGFANSA